MLGAIAALAQIAFDVAAGIEVRCGLAASGNPAYAQVARGVQYGIVAKHLGRVTSVVGIIDSFRGAERGRRHGKGEAR